MATDGRKTAKKRIKKMFKMVNSLSFKPKEDAELLEIVNEYAHMVKGVVPKQAVRNFLLNHLPKETKRLRNGGNFTDQPAV